MDRFIDNFLKGCEKMKEDLKSNMDRFIASQNKKGVLYMIKFKIQYG